MLTDSRLRVALLFSHRAPGLSYLLHEDGNRGLLYDVVACLSSEDAFPEPRLSLEEAGVPLVSHPLRAFHRWLRAPLRDLSARAVYDAAMVEHLERFCPDLVVLASYLYVLTEPMLERYPDRIVNLHHADLTLRAPGGGPRYPGLRAVRDAIQAGETATRATAHVVTPRLDDGPLLLRSWPFPVAELAADARAWGASDVLKAYSFAHQEWMLRAAWGPLLARSIELMATGRVVAADDAAWIDGVPGPLDLAPGGELLLMRGRVGAIAAAC